MSSDKVKMEPNLNPPPDANPAQPGTWAEEPPAPGMLDLLLALAERKWSIVGITLAGGLITAVVAFLLPPMYTATASIVPPQQQQSTAAALLGQLGPLAAAAGGNLGLRTSSDLYIGILGSRTIADHLVQAFDLRRLYDERTVSDARKVLAKRSSFSTGRESADQDLSRGPRSKTCGCACQRICRGTVQAKQPPRTDRVGATPPLL